MEKKSGVACFKCLQTNLEEWTVFQLLVPSPQVAMIVCRDCAETVKILHPGVPFEELAFMPLSEDKVTFTSGAQSSGKLPPYHLIPFTDGVLDRLANRYQLGIDKGYALDNWRKGLEDDAYVADRLNHGVNHLMRAIAKITRGDYTIGDDDDLAGAMWAIAFGMAAQKVRGGVK